MTGNPELSEILQGCKMLPPKGLKFKYCKDIKKLPRCLEGSGEVKNPLSLNILRHLETATAEKISRPNRHNPPGSGHPPDHRTGKVRLASDRRGNGS